ncbi:MAG TPA: hypothetical protein VM223_22545 [Planctomycetota bacterium]|nr:hypothetical protein [Planctomycetota bacterium]
MHRPPGPAEAGLHKASKAAPARSIAARLGFPLIENNDIDFHD